VTTLIKLLTDRRVSSRRKIKELIKDGHVRVNGKIVRDLSLEVSEKDVILIKGRRLPPPLPKVYLLMNKPKGYITSLDDPKDRKTVRELLPYKFRKLKVYPVGRLDLQSEGLLFFTNDGDIANIVLNSGLEKWYLVKVSGFPDEKKIRLLRKGVKLKSGIKTLPCKIKFLRKTKSNSWYEVRLKEGKKNQIRQMFEKIGHPVLKLKRTRIGNFYLKGIPLGGIKVLGENDLKWLKALTNNSNV